MGHRPLPLTLRLSPWQGVDLLAGHTHVPHAATPTASATPPAQPEAPAHNVAPVEAAAVPSVESLEAVAPAEAAVAPAEAVAPVAAVAPAGAVAPAAQDADAGTNAAQVADGGAEGGSGQLSLLQLACVQDGAPAATGTTGRSLAGFLTAAAAHVEGS